MLKLEGYEIYQDRYSQCFVVPKEKFFEFLEYQEKLDELNKYSQEFEDLENEFLEKFRIYCVS